MGGTLAQTGYELRRRRLLSVEDCAQLWAAAQDPLALLVAVTLSDIPRWLQDALILALYPRLPGRPSLHFEKKIFRDGWKRSESDRYHAARAWRLIEARYSPPGERPLRTWQEAETATSAWLRASNASGEPAAIAKSYRRTVQTLARNPWACWGPGPGLEARWAAALGAFINLIAESLPAAPSTSSPVPRRPRQPRRARRP